MARTNRKREEQDNFYEAMPATADQFRTWESAEEPDLPDQKQLTIDDTKTTAIITLILTAVVAVGLALLFLRGLEIIKGETTSTGVGSPTQQR
jgi:hypothetical protein